MNTWQLCNEIRNILQDLVWAGASNAVFGTGSVVVTVGPDVDVGTALRFPAALIRPLNADSDPEHSQIPDLIRQRLGIRLMTAVAGDALGEVPLIGGYWNTAADTSSDGRGLLEIEEAVYDGIQLLAADSGVEIQFKAASASQAILLEDLGYVAFRDYEFEAWVTASRDYPPAREFSATVLTSGAVSLTWVNPAIGRYDFRTVRLRRAVGTVPPTSNSDTLILTNADASFHTDTPGSGTFSYAIFVAYDDRQDPPATDRNFSEADTDTAVVP